MIGPAAIVAAWALGLLSDLGLLQSLGLVILALQKEHIPICSSQDVWNPNLHCGEPYRIGPGEGKLGPAAIAGAWALDTYVC